MSSKHRRNAPPPPGLKALVVASGQPFEGPTHGHAIQAALDAGAACRDEHGHLESCDGSYLYVDFFRTPEGEVIDRFDASERYGGWAGFNPYNPYAEQEEVMVLSSAIARNPEYPKNMAYEGIRVSYVPQTRLSKAILLNDPREVVRFATVMNMLEDVRERVYAIYLDQKHKFLGYRLLGAGGVDAAIVDPKVVLGPAVALHAPAIMLLHNHPSGGADPSVLDVKLTEMLTKGAALLGIRVVDHIVVGHDEWRSLMHDAHGELERAAPVAQNPRRRTPAPLPIVHPGARVQVIDESTDPPRWRTLANVLDTPRHIREVLEAHGLESAWVQDALGDRRMVHRNPLDELDQRPDADYDPEQLAMGIQVEYEHTQSLEVAKTIAKDHLDEMPDYYTRLAYMEASP